MRDHPYRLRFLTVEEDPGSTGIWAFEEGDWFNLEYEDLDLPKELMDRFVAWTRWYLRAFDQERFDAEGRALTGQLQAVVGPSVHVSYCGLGRDPRNGRRLRPGKW
jgi:hypothetical protein